jgi:POT family proton-dependent oligopeptide transporter
VSTTTSETGGRTFFGHPLPLATLFGTELWERFSYYGMRAILVLYLTASLANGGLGWSESDANALYGVYVGMVYLVALPGGWIADRLLGARRSVLYGGIVIACGHYTLAIPNTATFFLGLLLIVLGTGLLKPNISTMVGSLYEKDSPKRDAGFSLFYMGINIGGFFAPLIVGWLGQRVNWHLGFAAAGVGMTVAVVWYVAGRNGLRHVCDRPTNELPPAERKRVATWIAAAAGVVAVVAVALAAIGQLTVNRVVLFLVFVPIAVAIVYFWRMFADRSLTDDERSRLRAYVWLFVFAACFWLIYDQAGSVLNVFAEKQVALGGLPASWLQAVNPIFIIIASPLAGLLWVKLGHRLATPGKFAIGLVLNGFSFVLMAGAAAQAVGGTKVSPLWLVAVYAVQVLGELALSPVGLSVTTKLAPAAYLSQMLGLWFLATAVGDAIGGQVARLTASMAQSSYFLTFGLASVVVGIAAFGMRKALRGMMRGIH